MLLWRASGPIAPPVVQLGFLAYLLPPRVVQRHYWFYSHQVIEMPAGAYDCSSIHKVCFLYCDGVGKNPFEEKPLSFS